MEEINFAEARGIVVFSTHTQENFELTWMKTDQPNRLRTNWLLEFLHYT